VLVIGAGPVGLATMLWANFLGARHVIVSERAEVRRQMASKFGATDAIDPSQPLTSQVEKIAGKGPDVIFECVGVPGLIGQTMMEAPPGCRIVVAGVCQQPDTILPLIGIIKELELQFVLGYRDIHAFLIPVSGDELSYTGLSPLTISQKDRILGYQSPNMRSGSTLPLNRSRKNAHVSVRNEHVG